MHSSTFLFHVGECSVSCENYFYFECSYCSDDRTVFRASSNESVKALEISVSAVTPINQQNVLNNCLPTDSCIRNCQLCKNNLIVIAFRFSTSLLYTNAQKKPYSLLLQCKPGVYIELWTCKACQWSFKTAKKKTKSKKKYTLASKLFTNTLCVSKTEKQETAVSNI